MSDTFNCVVDTGDQGRNTMKTQYARSKKSLVDISGSVLPDSPDAVRIKKKRHITPKRALGQVKRGGGSLSVPATVDVAIKIATLRCHMSWQ